jgi:hypothetical protein
MLRQHLHCVSCPADVEAEIFVLDDTEEFTITFLKKKLTLLFQDRDVHITISQVVIPELNDVDRKWEADDLRQLLDGLLDVIDDTCTEHVQHEVAQGAFAAFTRGYTTTSSALNMVLLI